MSPKVSIIVPNYNHTDYLRQRIESILNQTFTDFELLLLDDYSTDNSKEILNEYKNHPQVSALLFNERNSGNAFLQWEKGIKQAKGEYLWIAESDDYADPQFLENTVREMDKHPDAQVCLTGSYLVDTTGNELGYDYDYWKNTNQTFVFDTEQYLLRNMLISNSIYNASMVLFRRKNCLKDITPEYKSMRNCGDWLFWIEQIQKGKVIEIRKKLNYFRWHGQNTTTQGIKSGNILLEAALVKEYLFRKITIDWKIKMICRTYFYQSIRHFHIDTHRKKELYRQARRCINATYPTYILGKIVRAYAKHIRKKDSDSLLCKKLP